MNTVRPICWIAYAPPTHRPRSSNARGRDADMARLTSISTTSSRRTAISSGSSQLVTQVVYDQTSQTMASSSPVCSAPARVEWPIR